MTWKDVLPFDRTLLHAIGGEIENISPSIIGMLLDTSRPEEPGIAIYTHSPQSMADIHLCNVFVRKTCFFIAWSHKNDGGNLTVDLIDPNSIPKVLDYIRWVIESRKLGD